MSKYEVSKISVNTYHMDGSACYDYSKTFDTWRELTKDMHQRDQYANEMFVGRGSVIEMDGEVIGNICDFYVIEGPINKVTRASLIHVNNQGER